MVVGRGVLANPEPEAEGRQARKIPGATQGLEGADEPAGTLELLDGQQPQRVTLDHRGAAAARSFHESAAQHLEGRHGQVRLGLSAAGGEPDEVDDRAVAMVRLPEAAQR
ncbi:hypothetical protein D3C87_1524720 [compost metagenome]